MSVSVSEDCDPDPKCGIASVDSNEPAMVGSGDTTPDWVIRGPLAVELRAERSGGGRGRVYTLTLQCTDASGNTSTTTSLVTVPHSR